MMRPLTAVPVLLLAAAAAQAQEPLPIIDMHLHAHAADHQGPPPRGICAPFAEFPARDPARPWGDVMDEMRRDPPCEDPIWSPPTDEALRDRTLEVLERRNIIGVLSGAPDRVAAWRTRSPERLLPGLELFNRYLRAIVEAGFGNRVLFGSDQMIWPEAIERAIATIEEAPFLTERQKRDIMYHNTARFLRLSEEEIARHHDPGR